MFRGLYTSGSIIPDTAHCTIWVFFSIRWLKLTYRALVFSRLHTSGAIIPDTAGCLVLYEAILPDGVHNMLVRSHTRRVLGSQVDQVSLQIQQVLNWKLPWLFTSYSNYGSVSTNLQMTRSHTLWILGSQVDQISLQFQPGQDLCRSLYPRQHVQDNFMACISNAHM